MIKVSAGVSNLLERKTRNFLWDGADGDSHMHLELWEIVARPKDLGGLGIRNLKLRNKALLGKWWWRFHLEENAL